ncbi:MAG: hypothetical protein ABJB05_05675, partial [Parafilimonas sp.]
MRKVLLLSLIILVISGCKNSAPDYSGNEKMTTEDFLKAFHELHLPVNISDTSLQQFADTIIINKAVFTEFIPDSSLNRLTQKLSGDIIIHPAGIIHRKEKDFLLATLSSKLTGEKQSKKIQLAVFALNDKHTFLADFPLLNNYENDAYNHSVSITEEPTFILKKEKISANNKSLYSRNGFTLNTASNSFTEILHDSNEDTAKNNEIINPIDTLAETKKFSGDY